MQYHYLIGGKGFNTGRLVRAILDGEIAPCDKKDGKGLASLLFSKQALIKYSWELRRGASEEYFCIPEAAKILGLEKNFTYSLTQGHILPTQEIKKGRRSHLVISKADIEFFSTTYKLLTIRDAQLLKTTTYRLAALLEKNGVKPVTEDTFVNRRYYIYKESELREINLAMIIAQERAQKKLEYKKSKLLNSAQVAQSLGISIQTVNRLVENGILPPHPISGNPAANSDYFFTSYVIENYKTHAVDSLDLISPSVAAGLLGERRGDFYEKWVRPGYAKPRMLKAAKNKNLFHRKDIEELVALKKNTLSLKETSESLGIRVAIILRGTKSGKLLPFLYSEARGYGYYRYWKSDIEKLKELGVRRRKQWLSN